MNKRQAVAAFIIFVFLIYALGWISGYGVAITSTP